MTEERQDRRGGGTAMPQPHGGAIGNPPYEVTEEKRRQVRELAGLQISQQEIADVMGVSADTIQRHHREDFDQGRAAFALKMRKHAFNLALGELKDPDDPSKGYKAHFTPDRDMTKFVMRSQFGWEDSVKVATRAEIRQAAQRGADPYSPHDGGSEKARLMGTELVIHTPRWALPLLGPGRYKGAHGGRGSGKSHERAEALIERCIMQKTDAVCIREVQRSLK
jgi:hypothetical protein